MNSKTYSSTEIVSLRRSERLVEDEALLLRSWSAWGNCPPVAIVLWIDFLLEELGDGEGRCCTSAVARKRPYRFEDVLR